MTCPANPDLLGKMLYDNAQLTRVYLHACQAPVAYPDGLRTLLGRQEAGSRASDDL